MNQAQADALLRLKEEQRESSDYFQQQRDMEAEKRDQNGGATEYGKIRRWSPQRYHNDLTATMMRQTNYLTVIFQQLLNEQLLKNAAQVVSSILHSLESRPDNNSYLKVADTLAPGLGVEYTEVAVSKEVADTLQQEIKQVHEAEQSIRTAYASEQHGPFGAHKRRHDLLEAFRLRFDPDTKTYAHCMQRVADISREKGCVLGQGSCVVPVFGVVSAPKGHKGYDSKIAEAGQEMTASNLANIEAAAPALPIPPPQFNFVG